MHATPCATFDGSRTSHHLNECVLATAGGNQGYRRHRIRPDFVVQDKGERKPRHRVIVIESKGTHLDGNPDTSYKRAIADVFGSVGHEVTWQQLGEDFKDHIFRFQILDEAGLHGRDWSDELRSLLAGAD